MLAQIVAKLGVHDALGEREAGTGNTVNLSHQRVLQMVADSLRRISLEAACALRNI
jgi:hypothetical protein